MKRTIYIVGIALLVAVVVFLGWRQFAKPAKVEQQPTSVRLAWVYDMAEAGVFVAQDKGYFDEEGLKVEIKPGGFGLDPIKLVATGEDEFGVAGAGNVLLARAQGVPVVAIGVEFQDTPVGFIVNSGSGIHGFPDFRGKRVGIQTGADTDVLYRALLKRNGMTSRDVREVPIQYDMLPFTGGQIDVLPGYVTNQPVTLRSKGFAVDVISASSQGLNYYGNVYITSEKMLAEHPEKVCALVRSLQKGWRGAFSDKAGTVAAVQRRTKEFSASDLDPIYEAVMPFIRPTQSGLDLLKMRSDRWETTKSVLVDAGLLKADLDTSRAYSNACFK